MLNNKDIPVYAVTASVPTPEEGHFLMNEAIVLSKYLGMKVDAHIEVVLPVSVEEREEWIKTVRQMNTDIRNSSKYMGQCFMVMHLDGADVLRSQVEKAKTSQEADAALEGLLETTTTKPARRRKSS